MARRTCDGSSEPDEQADPVETATPSRSSAMRSDSASRPSKLMFDVFGTRRAAVAVHAACPARPTRMPASSRSRSGAAPSPVLASCSRASRAATPSPPSEGTFSVPARRFRSCRPPVMSGVSRRPRRIHRAPTPFGPPNLWPESDSRSTPSDRADTGMLAGRLHGIGVEQGAVLVGDAGQLGDRLDRADLVVRVHHGDEGRLGPRQAAEGVRATPRRTRRQGAGRPASRAVRAP